MCAVPRVMILSISLNLNTCKQFFLLYRLNYNDFRPMRFLSRVSMGIFYNISFLGPTLYKVALTTITHIKKYAQCTYVCILYCKTLLLILRWDTGRLGTGLVVWVGFKGVLRSKGWVNRVIIHFITDVITYRYFSIYKYNVNACMNTIRALYQWINLNAST